MTIHEKYLESLKIIGGWVIVSEWAKKFAELYPDEYAKAEAQARNQKNDTSGLRVNRRSDQRQLFISKPASCLNSELS